MTADQVTTVAREVGETSLGTSTLSMPCVVQGEACSVRVPGAVLLDRVVLLRARGSLHVSVWQT